MIKLATAGGAGLGGVMLTRAEMMAWNVGSAEECVKCGRRYCDNCFPTRPKNSCVCGQGKGLVEERDGVTCFGSMRLVKVQYTD